jgi:hypothetical protein
MQPPLTDDQKRVRSYLLRLAPEEELDRIEETYLATSGYSDMIGDAEQRLVSDYVQQRLSDEETRAFESNFLVTSDRLEQVAIAEAISLLPASDARAERLPAVEQRPNFWRRFLNWVAAPGPVFGLAGAAVTVALLFTVVGLFVFRTAGSRQMAIIPRQPDLPRLAASRVFGIPVLKVEEASLASAQPRKLHFRLPAVLPDMLFIPLELPEVADGASVDAVLSVSTQTIWAEQGLALRGAGAVRQADLQISFSSLLPYLGRSLKLEIIERGHAVLATYHLTFESAPDR